MHKALIPALVAMTTLAGPALASGTEPQTPVHQARTALREAGLEFGRNHPAPASDAAPPSARQHRARYRQLREEFRDLMIPSAGLVP